MKAWFGLPAVAAVIALGSAVPASAATLFTENFESYAVGSLVDASPTWTVTLREPNFKVKVVDNEAIDGDGGNLGLFGGSTNSLPYFRNTPGYTPQVGDTSNTGKYLGSTGYGAISPADTTVVTTAAFSTQALSVVTLSFDYAAYRSEEADKLTVRVFDALTNALLQVLPLGPKDDSTGHDGGLAWKSFSQTFQTFASSIFLEFSFNFSEDEAGYLDNVLVTAVPVPAALPLGAAALGGLGLLGWSRRKRNEAAAA
jgi:hypothetical protein